MNKKQKDKQQRRIESKSVIAAAKRSTTMQRLRQLAVCAALAIAVAIVYGQTFSHAFINYDDYEYVVSHPQINPGITLHGLSWIMTHGHVGNWHPLTSFSHMLDCQFFGVNPSGHHATNFVLHALAAVLLFRVLLSLSGEFWPSALAAGIFAVHPLRVESVAWVSTRKDVLSGVFFMLTIWAYLRFVRGSFRWSRYVLMLLAFTLGLMSKPTLVALPAVLLLLDVWPLNRPRTVAENGAASESGVTAIEAARAATWPHLLLEKVPLIVITAAFCVVTLSTQRASMLMLGDLPMRWRFANALVSTVAYLRAMVVPIGLAPFYQHPMTSLPILAAVGSGMAIAGITAIALIWRKRFPYLLFGWLWYLVTLAPVSGIIQVGSQSHADRYTYLPQIGLCIAFAWGLRDAVRAFPRCRTWVACGASAMLLALTAAANIQTSHWKNSESLWRHALAVTEPNNLILENLAISLASQNRFEEAVPYFQQAIALKPSQVAHYNLGIVYCKLKHEDLALAEWNEALKFDPLNPYTHLNLGNILARRGNLAASQEHFRTTLSVNPDNAEALYGMGCVLAACGKYSDAAASLKRALLVDPNNAQTHRILSKVLLEMGKASEAQIFAQRAVEIENHANALATGGVGNQIK